MDPIWPRVDSRRPAVWYRHIPCRHPAALGGRTSRPLDSVGPHRCPSPQRISAEDRYTSGSCSCLARVCALVGTANANIVNLSPKDGEENMSANSATATIPSPHRKLSLTAGIFYLLTFVSIPTLALYNPVKGAHYVLGPGPDTSAIVGGILEIIVALAGIGTAVALFPMLKKQDESAALGLVAARILESGTIFVGVAFLLSIVTLRKSGAGADALATSHALVALYNRIFLLGQSFMPAICDLLLGFLLYKSRLVPRRLSVIGIVGSPILIASYLAVLFSLIGQHAPLAGLFAIPVALFEFSLGIYLVVKGFKPSPVTAGM